MKAVFNFEGSNAGVTGTTPEEIGRNCAEHENVHGMLINQGFRDELQRIFEKYPDIKVQIQIDCEALGWSRRTWSRAK